MICHRPNPCDQDLGAVSRSTSLRSRHPRDHRVRRLMAKMGLEAIYKHPRTSQPHSLHPVFLYLLRKMQIDRPNQVWCSDITFVPVKNGFLYLVAIADAEFAAIHFAIYVALEAGRPNAPAAGMNFDSKSVDFERFCFQPHDYASSLIGGSISRSN